MSKINSSAPTFVKDCACCFSHLVPPVLQNRYSSQRVVHLVRTCTAQIVEARARRDVDQLNEYRYHLRFSNALLAVKRLSRYSVNTNPTPTCETAHTATILSYSQEPLGSVCSCEI